MTRDIFVPVMDRLKATRREKFKDLISLIKYLDPTFEPANENYPNFEDFFAQIEMARRFNSKNFITSTLWPQRRLQRAEKALKQALAGYLWQFTRRPSRRVSRSLKSTRTFLGRIVQPGDVIVTFNWDLTVERANTLVTASKAYDLQYSYATASSVGTGKGRRVTLLKPHGSIDWFTRAQVRSIKNVGQNDFFKVGTGIFAYNHFRHLKHHHLSRLIPVIVPPTPFKEFRFEALRDIWRDVFRSVRRADSIHIIGYSLPPEDQFARFIFRRVFRLIARDKVRPSITVVNRAAGARDTFRRTIGAELPLVFKQMTFERWVKTA